MRIVALACLLLASIVTSDEVTSYRNHEGWSCQAQTEQQVRLLQQIHLGGYDGVVFLRFPSLGMSTDFVVPPHHKDHLSSLFMTVGLNYTVVTADLQVDIDREREESERNKRYPSGRLLSTGKYAPSHDAYYTWTQMKSHLENLEAAYPQLMVIKTLPLRSEADNEIIPYVEIGTQDDPNKPVIMMEGMAHAREWIVGSSLLYTIDTMLKEYTANTPRFVDALSHFTFVIIPILNPDGYKYSWTNTRMWRKNRKFISQQCRGVDLNRNFDVDFGNVGVSFNCRDDIYLGPSPFSEAETQNVALLFEALKPRVVSYLSIHSYGQFLLYPWGYLATTNPSIVPDNLDQLISAGQDMVNALESNGKAYRLGTAYGLLRYAASGAAEDWALSVKSGIYAYCYELRPRTSGEGAFIIPPSEIIPSGQEFLMSILALGEFIAVELGL